MHSCMSTLATVPRCPVAPGPRGNGATGQRPNDQWPNDQWPNDQMTEWPNDQMTEMTKWPMTKWPADAGEQMTKWAMSNDQMTCRRGRTNDQVTNEQMTKWPNEDDQMTFNLPFGVDVGIIFYQYFSNIFFIHYFHSFFCVWVWAHVPLVYSPAECAERLNI